MKKYSIILSAVLSIIALASCQKEQDIKEQDINQEEVKENVQSSVPFVLRANIPSVDTKTTLNTSTWAVNWESGDVIYAVTTDAAWGEAYPTPMDETIAEFAYNSSNGTFSTDMAIADGSHTFNFLYTAGQQKSYHRAASTTFQLAGTQTFDASAPTASLKLYDALAAQVEATTPTSFADVEMSHLFSLMKVTLKNKTGDDVNITKFEIEIPGEKLYGIFNVEFDTTPSTSIKSGDGDKITVNISNGTVASDGTLDVYFVMGPVAGYTGEVTFTVTDSASNTYTKTNTISAPGVTFAAGTYNTASYSLKTADPVQCVTLDWNYAGGTSSDLLAIPGVSANGLGSDYAENNAPYRVKFDNTGDYIQVRTDAAISTVSVGYKMFGTSPSYLNIFESTDGASWGDRIDRLTIPGTQNSTGILTTTATFNPASRFVKIVFEKGGNVGIGAISITKPNTDPAIVASDIYDVAAIGCTDEPSTYTALNFTDDVEVGTVTGCVSDADAATGDIFYSVTPNYESTEATGTIVLQSAGNNAITKTITVHQLGSSLTVSKAEVIIPADDDEATFTITSPEFDWSITADDDTHVLYDDSGNASNSASTVTVTSDLEATDAVQTIATLTIIRNSNNSDPQAKQVVIKKAAAGEVSYTVTFPDDNSSSNGLSSYTGTWTAMAGSFSLSITNFNNNAWNNNWTYIKCGRKNNASVATIITDSAISEAIKTIKITIDALTASKINSIILYISSDGSSWAEGGTFTKATGEQSVTISNPQANRYYKLVFDCASGSSNGLLTLSKIVYTTK